MTFPEYFLPRGLGEAPRGESTSGGRIQQEDSGGLAETETTTAATATATTS